MKSRLALVPFLPVVLLLCLALGTRVVDHIDTTRLAGRQPRKRFDLMISVAQPADALKAHQLRAVGVHTLTVLQVRPNHDATADLTLSDGTIARVTPEDASDISSGDRVTIHVAPVHTLRVRPESHRPTYWLLSTGD